MFIIFTIIDMIICYTVEFSLKQVYFLSMFWNLQNMTLILHCNINCNKIFQILICTRIGSAQTGWKDVIITFFSSAPQTEKEFGIGPHSNTLIWTWLKCTSVTHVLISTWSKLISTALSSDRHSMTALNTTLLEYLPISNSERLLTDLKAMSPTSLKYISANARCR